MDEFLYESDNPEAVKQALERMPEDQLIEDLSNFYKVMGDPTRLRLLMTLATGELSVSDLCNVISMNRSAVSHQLRELRNAKLVKARKTGKTVYYSLDDDHVLSVLNVALEHVKE
ncbi:MAG: winged helix-turn-helix transcriptional regulator [Erysipelotrichaceae bacterium]|nr:winged helix-turn-helix transcriptional regulator [Erysipelotrichaceae bacterium]